MRSRELPDTHRLARGILIAANHSECGECGCLEPPLENIAEDSVTSKRSAFMYVNNLLQGNAQSTIEAVVSSMT
jgi:hypothetical protein